jgi:hypothetical protein
LELQAQRNPGSKELADRLFARQYAEELLKNRMLPDDDWQGVVFKKVKDQFKERRRFKDPTA